MTPQELALAAAYATVSQPVLDDLIAHARSLGDPLERAGAWALIGHILHRQSSPRRKKRGA